MKINIVSDIHTEFLDDDDIHDIIDEIQDADVLILAGDIGKPLLSSYSYFLENVSVKFKKVFIITGNHEYYGNHVDDMNEKIKLICDKIENVSFLNNTFEDYEGYRWVGTTLWTNIDPDTSYFTNDTRFIKDLNVRNYNLLHDRSVNFLRGVLDVTQLQCVVISHHIPSYNLIHPKYVHDKYNQWFASNQDKLIEEHTDKIKLWVYGHTHIFTEKTMFNTKFICNPIGYEDENEYPKYNYVYTLESS
jgi:predicted phosphodiesterase